MLKLAVIGDPISHSLSPQIHTEVLRSLNIDCEYRAVRVKKGELAQWIEEAKKNGIAGFNATMPHKQDIIKYIDEIDSEAKRCNSVNTVKIRDGKLYGYSTDGGGFLMSLMERGITLSDKNVLIAGTGGAAAVLIAASKAEGAKSVMSLGRNSLGDIKNHAWKTDIFVNATPLGMHGCSDDWSDLDFVGEFPKHAIIYDTIYNPMETSLLIKAKDSGLTTINGLSMLVCQAVLADLIYI